MKKQLLFILLTLLPMVASADKSGSCGTNVTYIYVESTHTLTISGTGSMANYNYSYGIYSPWHNYRSEIWKIVIENGVTSIGNYAFFGCSGLTSVTIGSGVTSIGDWAFSGCSGLEKVTFHCPSIGSWFSGMLSIKEINIGDEVTSIGDNAFYGCSGLTSVHITDLAAWCGILFGNNANPLYYAHHLFLNEIEITNLVIPNSVTSIGRHAFYGCSGLTSVTIPNSVTSIGVAAFAECSGLTSVTIPNSVTHIGSSAFGGCSKLESVKVPVTDYAAFCNNTIIKQIRGIYISVPITLIDENENEIKEYIIPNSVTSIGDYAFYNCSGLTSVTIPNGVTSIGDYAFYNCSGLTSVTIPNSVTSIDYWTFDGCSGLKSIKVPVTDYAAFCNNTIMGLIRSNIFSKPITLIDVDGNEIKEYIIPNSVTSIGDYAFYNCSGLTSVTIPNSVTSIGGSAFSGCSGLTSVTIPDGVTSIDVWAFNGCSGLISVAIPNSVTTIMDYAFQGCSGLTSVTIPNSVTSIGYSAFENCSGLTSVTIPNSVTSIGKGAFCRCSGITSVTIPNSVTSIDSEAFQGCSGLTSVTIPNSVTSIGNYAFDGCENLLTVNSEITEPFNCRNAFSTETLRKGTLYIPAGTKDLYTRFDGWREFLKIEEVGGEAEQSVWLSIKDAQSTTKIKLKKGTKQELVISPEEGWKILSVTMDGTDVTAQVTNGGSFTTPAINSDASIIIVYEQEVPSGVRTARSQADVKVVSDGVVISNAEPDTRCVIYSTDGQQVVNTVISEGTKKITLQQGQVYILTIDGRTLKFAL
jgi:hypothetical protein